MSSKVRVAIIGCGGIANGKHLPCLSRLDNVDLVAFCDIVEDKAEKAAEKYGVKGAKVYKNYQKLLAAGGTDVVHVLTPNAAHAPITIAALEAGNHVMCEKPIAKTSKEALAMIAAAKKSKKKLTIGYNNRYRADSLYLKDICKRGDLGEIYFAKAHAVRRRAVPTWGVFLDEEQQGGGPLIDIGTHALDLTLWLMDNYEPKTVLGSKYRKLADTENAANAFGPWDPKLFTVEDSAFGMITFKNGATVYLESSWALNTREVGEAISTLCGTKGGADFRGGLYLNGEDNGRTYETKIDLSTGGVAFFSGKAESDADIEARLWIDAVVNDKEPVVLPHQAYIVSLILEAIYESAKTGKAVEL